MQIDRAWHVGLFALDLHFDEYYLYFQRFSWYTAHSGEGRRADQSSAARVTSLYLLTVKEGVCVGMSMAKIATFDDSSMRRALDAVNALSPKRFQIHCTMAIWLLSVYSLETLF